MALTSIIITTHNRPQLLGRAVESALDAGTDVEVIVVDDASSDETSNVSEDLSGIRYVRIERQQRVAGARNVGLLASKGEYITFLDDDDMRLRGSIDLQVKLLEEDTHAGMIYGQAHCLDQERQTSTQIYPLECPEGDVFWELLAQNFIPCGSAVFRRSCLERVGILDDYLSGLDDWDLWIRIAELFPVIALKEPVMQWRRSHPTSKQGTSEASVIVSKCVKQFRKSWLKLPRVAGASRRLRRQAWDRFSVNMAAHLCWETIRSLRHRNAVQALKNFFTLPLLGPLVIVSLVRQNVGAKLWRKVVLKTRATPSLNSPQGRI